MTNVYAIPPFLAAGLNASLLYWVFTQAPPGLIRRTFLFWNGWLLLWNVSCAVGYMVPDAATATLWYHWTIPPFVSFQPTLFLHFIAALTGATNQPSIRRYIKLAYGCGFVFLAMGLFSNLLIGPAVGFFWGYYPVAGGGTGAYSLFYFLVIGYAFFILINALRKATGHQRNQLKYVLLGAIVTYSSGSTNFLPLYHVGVYPVGNLMNALYSLLLAYGILEFSLLDIRVILRRSTVYALLTGGLTAVYLMIVGIFEHLFGHYGVAPGYVYYTAAVPITGVLAPAVKSRIEPFIENVRFWKRRHSFDVLPRFERSVFSTLDLPTVARHMVEQMMSVVETDSGALYVSHSGQTYFEQLFFLGMAGPRLLEPYHPVIIHLLSEKEELVKEKALWQYHLKMKTSSSDVKTEEALKTWPYALALPLFLPHQFLGVVALGQKLSGDMFNEEDIQLLRTLAKPAAIALGNARDVAQMQARQKALTENHDAALLGMLATEIAHELSKPLTRIMNEQTRLERTLSGKSKGSLDKIEKEAQRASEILDGFAMLSPERTLHRIAVSLPGLIEEAEHALGIQEDARLRILHQYDALPDIFVNPGQVVQVLTNVIQNAWEAMPEGGTLTLSLHGVSSEGRLSSVIVTVTDTGHGVAPDIQGKVFQPFFTTKESKGGRGVGLSISKAMIQRHGGDIQLESPTQDGGGTRVTITLPIIQNQENPS